MGILDSFESMTANTLANRNDNTTKVTGALTEALEQHPGGLSAILQNFRNNGLGGHVDAMQNGQTPSVSPDQVQTGLQGTGLLDTIAAKAGVSPQIAKAVLATVLPMVMAHFAQNGSTPNSSILSGMLSKLGRPKAV